MTTDHKNCIFGTGDSNCRLEIGVVECPVMHGLPCTKADNLSDLISIKYFHPSFHGIDFPTAPQKPKMPPKNATSTDFVQYGKTLEAYEDAMTEYMKLRAFFNTKAGELNQEWEALALEHVGIAAWPERHILFNKAYEYGHASGKSEILGHLIDLVDMMRQIKKIYEEAK